MLVICVGERSRPEERRVIMKLEPRIKSETRLSGGPGDRSLAVEARQTKYILVVYSVKDSIMEWRAL